MRSSEVAFRLESSEAGAEEMRALAEAFPSAHETLPPVNRTYFDTFDWRIFAKGGVITESRSGGHHKLEWRRSRGRALVLDVAKPPRFATDLPAGQAREALADVIEVRRLLPVVRVTGHSQVLRILNSDRKTVARARIDERYAAAGHGSRPRHPLAPALRLIPVRGYRRETRRVEKFLASRLGPACKPAGELTSALEAIGQRPAAYSSKLALRLAPSLGGGEAARQIHRMLLQTILANEPGVRDDLDSEFLHDFRVAVRRTRTALGQIRRVYPATARNRFKKEFSWLGRLTGPSRDLDVFLERMAGYRADLPAAARADLAPLEAYVRRRRASERRRLIRGFDSLRYRRLLVDWRRFLDSEPATEELPSDAALPVREVAEKNIRRAYRVVLRKGAKITDESPAEALHGLRIDCKKLRYLFEFFRSLFRAAEIGPVIGELKRLQDNLGDFNDYAVQQEMMKDHAGGLGKKGATPVATLLGVGRLVGHLEDGEATERRRFAARFARFSSPKSRRLFRRLLEADGEGGGER